MKPFGRILLLLLTVALVVFYLLACLTPFISPIQWVLMGFLGLAFPALFVAMVFAVLIWFFVRKRVAGILLVIIACGSYHISNMFGWQKNIFSIEKAAGCVRIMGWNVKDFEKNVADTNPLYTIHYPLFRYISQQRPDIICLQDFYQSGNTHSSSNINELRKLGYPYYLFSNDYQEYPFWGPNYSGTAIFSKYPLQHVQRIPFAGKKFPESIITADVSINHVTRRIITTHLQSMHLKNLAPKDKGYWIRDEDSAVNYSRSVYKKMRYYLPYHVQQAKLVHRVIDESPYPVIFSADMNETPASYCYHVIKGKLTDAFLQKGTGIGRTYYRISPTLRIDYLFASAGTEVMQYKSDTVLLSDHYPQLMDIKW